MVEESDGINELTGATMRVALTVAGVIAEGRMSSPGSRLASNPDAARAALAAVMDDGWWDQAQVYDIACAWETAKTWEDIDEDAKRTAQHVRAQLRRLGVDVDNLNADPRAVEAALRYDSRERRKRLAARLKALGVPTKRSRRACWPIPTTPCRPVRLSGGRLATSRG
jgi:hypothetical protein